jgi:inhibitor of cysteine peptidase
MYAPGAACDRNPERDIQPMLIIVESDNGRTVDVPLGESVRINLPENATTGYRWAIDRYDEEFIEALATEPRYTANAIGSGGEVAFIFQGKKIGTGEIVLKHWRHWEGDSSVTNRFRIRLNVRP